MSKYPCEAFKDKVIYCPMDVAVNTGATMQSQFVKYFQINAHLLQFKKLICTCLVERAAGEGESLDEVQNCYVLERVTVPSLNRNIWGYTHGYGKNGIAKNAVVDEREDLGVVLYEKEDGSSHKVPWHIINQAVTEPQGRNVIVRRFFDGFSETDGSMKVSEVDTGKTWYFEGLQLRYMWCKKHPDGAVEPLPKECYFFNNADTISDFSIFPKDENGNPCFETVDGGSVCLYPSEYYDYREVEYKEQDEYAEYFSHCPADSQWSSGDFRSEYCKRLLAEADIVVTNPPFSCYSDDTEVKTNHGWKLFRDVNIENDLILSLNPDTLEMEYVRAVDSFCHAVDGKLLHFKNRHMNLKVTGNHRMLTWYRMSSGECQTKRGSDGKPVLLCAENLKKSYALPISGFTYNSTDSMEIIIPSTTQLEQYSRREIVVPEKHIDLEAWLEFFGFYLADGCYRDHITTQGTRDYTISIKQSEENEEYVLGLIDKIGYKCSISRNDSGNHNYCIHSKQLWEFLSEFGRSEDKYIPDEYLNLAPEYLKCLLRGYTNGDSHGTDEEFIYSSRSKRLMENIQEILLKVWGRLWQVRDVHAKYKGQDYVYYMIRMSLNISGDSVSKYGVPEYEDYQGYVYCLQLERNGVMLVRRGDTAAWCGNCFREFWSWINPAEKKFLIIGNKNAIEYADVFKAVKCNNAWFGFGSPAVFDTPSGETKQVSGLCRWFTNLDICKRHEFLVLTQEYNSELYPKYDYIDAIEVSKVDKIPYDYYGIMGVPVTFMDKYNPEQFELIDCTNGRYGIFDALGVNAFLVENHYRICSISGVSKYARILIRRLR